MTRPINRLKGYLFQGMVQGPADMPSIGVEHSPFLGPLPAAVGGGDGISPAHGFSGTTSTCPMGYPW